MAPRKHFGSVLGRFGIDSLPILIDIECVWYMNDTIWAYENRISERSAAPPKGEQGVIEQTAPFCRFCMFQGTRPLPPAPAKVHTTSMFFCIKTLHHFVDAANCKICEKWLHKGPHLEAKINLNRAEMLSIQQHRKSRANSWEKIAKMETRRL